MVLLSDRCTFQLQDPYVDDPLRQGEGFRSLKISAILKDRQLKDLPIFEPNEVGSIIVSWIDPQIWEERCATPLHYTALLNAHHDVHAVLCEKGPDLTNLPKKDTQEVVQALSKMFHWVEHFEARAAIKQAIEEHREEWQVAVDRMVGQPYVEYIKVRKNFRRQGLAKAMYAIAGCYMATKGLTLRGSTCQHYKATAVWSSMVQDPVYPTRKIEIGNQERVLLDYRNQQLHQQKVFTYAA